MRKANITLIILALMLISVFQVAFVYAAGPGGCACEWTGFPPTPQCNNRCSSGSPILCNPLDSGTGGCIDPCDGVMCDNQCNVDLNILYYGAQGTCYLGVCSYQQQVCEYGCSNGNCNPPPVAVSPQCNWGEWQDDGCGQSGCAANEMSRTRTPTNEPCEHVGLDHQCVADPACPSSGGGGGGSGTSLLCTNTYLYRECTGCELSSEVWMNSCNGYLPYKNEQPDSSSDCATCTWCSPREGDCPAVTTPPSTTPGLPPAAIAPVACDPVTVAVHPLVGNSIIVGNDVSVRASSGFGYGNVAFDAGGGATLVGTDVCNPDPPANCVASPFVWVQAAKASATPGAYTMTFSGDKQGEKCTQTVQYTVAAAPPATPPAAQQASSATKEVAKVLLKYSESNALEGKTGGYTLFCDSYDKTLNYHSYADQGANVGSTLSQEAGNVCVLRFDALSTQKVLFGAPLKQDLSKSDKVLGVLGDKACDSSVKNEGADFKACNAASKKIWHRKTAQDNGIVVYSKESFDIPTPEPAFLQDVAAFLRKLLGLQPSQTTAVFSLVEKAQNLDKIYVSVSGNKRVTGIVDNVDGKQAIVVEYSGFSTNVCSTVNAYFNSLTPASAPCTDLGGGKYAVSADCSVNPQVCNAWLDLTAKLRIQ